MDTRYMLLKPPREGAPMLNRARKPALAVVILAVTFVVPAGAQRVVTSQYDNARTGTNLNETSLTPRNVNVQHLGKLFTLHVDGDVYAQPLFVAGVEIPGKGRHDVLFIATEHDSVYAFDAYGNPSSPLWQVSLLKDGLTTVPADDAQCPFIAPEIGITSTPVIDPDSGTLYVLARTRGRQVLLAHEYPQQLHALDVATGQEKLGGPIKIDASIIGSGPGSSGGKLAFNPLRDNPRAAMLLSRGTVYLSWASACDVGPYHGWMMAYDARSLQQKAVFNASPDGDDSGIWAGDTGPAADQAGDIFVATGNGRFDANKSGRDYGDTLLKLDGQSLKIKDYFAPFNVDALDAGDSDLGSGGPMLLPDQAGAHPHLAVVEGKGSTLYLVNRDHMGHWQPGSDSHAVQTIHLPNGVFGSMTYWNHYVYVLSDSDALRQFEVKEGKLSPQAASSNTFPGVSATPIVSANGSRDGVVWILRSKGWNAFDQAAVLFAYDAADVSHELYTSEQNASRDRAGLALRFNIPTVVNGHVYVGAKHEVDVYGLLPPAGK
jgi:hypothetical protein